MLFMWILKKNLLKYCWPLCYWREMQKITQRSSLGIYNRKETFPWEEKSIDMDENLRSKRKETSIESKCINIKVNKNDITHHGMWEKIMFLQHSIYIIQVFLWRNKAKKAKYGAYFKGWFWSHNRGRY